MKIAIVGYDLEGKASYNYFAPQGHEICIRDQNHSVDVPAGVPAVLGEDYLNGLDEFDLIIRTAGLNPSKILAKNPAVANKITTQIQEFMRASPTKNIIGVTGTKGKGTTSTLICKILEAAGKDTKLGGNIGIPPLTFIELLNKDSWVVLELSSFQLTNLQVSPHIAVCVMVTPEHLDWHSDVDEYYAAKSQLFAHQSDQDKAIYFAENDNSRRIASAGSGKKIPYFRQPGAFVENGSIRVGNQEVCKTNELKLLGSHNWQNVCAAITAVWEAGVQDIEAMRSVLTTFTGLPHRLEKVRELDGVTYYDDSFGTTPETAIVAIKAFAKPEIVILGGSDKGIPFDELASVVSSATNVKKVITIGQTGPVIAEKLRNLGYQDVVMGDADMDGIVGQARQFAEPGDIVLLSTGCASFGMFKNYKDRAQQFIAAVQALV